MIKIAFLCSTLNQTGPTSQLMYLSEGMKYKGYEVKVIVLSKPSKKGMYQQFCSRKIDVTFISSSRYNLPRLLFLTRKVLKSFEPDFVHSQGIRGDLIQASLHGKYKTSATLRNEPFKDYVDLYGKAIGFPSALLHTFLLKRIEKVVCVSDSVKRSAFSYDEKRVITIQNGVDFGRFLPRRNRLYSPQINLNEIKVIFTGPLIKRKNVRQLVKLWGNLPCNRPQLDIVGQDAIDLTNFNLPHDVKLHGHRDDVSKFLQKRSVFISLSRSEGFPNSVLEALATGLPCILSDIEPHREIYDMIPDLVALVPLNCDVEELLDAFQKTKQTLSSYQHTDIRKICEQKFSMHRMIEKYSELFRHG